MGLVVVHTLCLLLVSIVIVLARFIIANRKARVESWHIIVGRLVDVDMESLREIGDCYLNPRGGQLRFQPREMLDKVGGLSGLTRLEHNANVMLDLARHAERWDDDNGRAISEMVRRDAVRVKRGIRRVRWAYVAQVGILNSALDLQETVATYGLMRERVLDLYAGCHAGRLPWLAEHL